MEKAWQHLLRDNPLPAVSGRVCYHPCESSCNRARLDSTVSIQAVERFLGNRALAAGWRVGPLKPLSVLRHEVQRIAELGVPSVLNHKLEDVVTKMRILVAIDFSECSNLALSHAVKLIGQTGARLHLGYIAHSGAFLVDTTFSCNIPDEFPEAQKALADLQQLQAQLGVDINSESHVRLSMSAQQGLLGLIMELKPDLVVAGSHGKGVFKRALLGSVCHQLALRSPIPILIVPAPGREELLNEPVPGKSS